MTKIKAIRLTPEENKLVEAFLKANPLFDFSSLARVAILQFVQNPKIEIKGVRPPTKGQGRREREETL